MNVLSTFDGMSCGQLALERVGIKVDNYFASEVDPFAMKVTMKNFPNTVQLGSVSDIKGKDLPMIHLLIGGSPCQGFSVSGKGLNFDDPRSALFFEYVRLLQELREVNPGLLFLLENVKMKKEWQNIISSFLGVEPVEINSALVSAQNRRRLYWTNIKGITQPADKGILLKDILESHPDPSFYHSQIAINFMNKRAADGRNRWDFHKHSDTSDSKSCCLISTLYKGAPNNVIIDRRYNITSASAERMKTRPANFQPLVDPEKAGTISCHNNSGKSIDFNTTFISTEVDKKYQLSEIALKRVERKNGNGSFRAQVNPEKTGTLNTKNNSGQLSIDNGTTLIESDSTIRRLTPIECERLQTVPDNYTAGVSDTQRYKMLGNGWTVDVIAHIFSFLNLPW